MTKCLVYVALALGIPADCATYVCWRWAWTGDGYDRKSQCLEWRVKA